MAPSDTQYDSGVSEPRTAPDPLAELLQQLQLQTSRAGSPSEAARTESDLLLDRLAALTRALRGADASDTSRIAARLLLADVAMAAARLRGDASTHAASLMRVLDDVREILDRTSPGLP
jgi:hypothetical protein